LRIVDERIGRPPSIHQHLPIGMLRDYALMP
jgi:hypothetical protein